MCTYFIDCGISFLKSTNKDGYFVAKAEAEGGER